MAKSYKQLHPTSKINEEELYKLIIKTTNPVIYEWLNQSMSFMLMQDLCEITATKYSYEDLAQIYYKHIYIDGKIPNKGKLGTAWKKANENELEEFKQFLTLLNSGQLPKENNNGE